MEWEWESFPEYLDAIEAKPHALDIGTQVPHGAVRAYVMGDRGAKNEPATPEDIEKMGAIVKEGLLAGALGFSSSRTLLHRAKDGDSCKSKPADFRFSCQRLSEILSKISQLLVTYSVQE